MNQSTTKKTRASLFCLLSSLQSFTDLSSFISLVSLQEPSRKLVNAHIKSLTVAATKGATANRFRLYESYCVENSIPVFPIVSSSSSSLFLPRPQR